MKARILFASLLTLAAISLSAQEAEKKDTVKKYAFKSAIVKINTVAMGQEMESTAYIDEFGNKECQKVSVSIPGVGDIETASISKDGKIWQVNYKTKQIQETPASVAEQPNFLTLTDEDIKKYNIQEVGKEKVLSKDCTVYTMEAENQGMKAKIKGWCYKGFMLKQELEVAGMKVVTTVTEFNEDAPVLPQVFDVPKF